MGAQRPSMWGRLYLVCGCVPGRWHGGDPCVLVG
jgi:hypothetical protein